jgi:hypothetical protein
VGSTFIRQPGQAEIPNKDHLIKKLAQDFDCSSLILDTLKVIIDEIFSESEYTKSFYEIALNIPSVLRVFNIMGFPLYSAQTLSDTFVFAYSNDYALAQSFYDFVDNKLKATVASDFTTKCIQALSALNVATSNIDRNKFESSMGEDLEVEFYNNLFRNDSFSEFRNESFALQLTPTDVEAVLAGESYTPPTQVPTPNLTVESTLDILNDKTVLKTWLEQEQLKLEYAQERTKSQAKAVFVLTAFAVASYLGYRKQKEVSKLLAI